MTELFFEKFVLLFFLLTPFASVSIFMSMTTGMAGPQRRKTAIRTTFGVLVITVIIYLCGRYIFQLFGITLDAFRIGAGALLFLSAVSLVRGNLFYQAGGPDEDISVVPMAMPVIVGSGTTGALFLMGMEMQKYPPDQRMTAWGVSLLALTLAVLGVGAMLYIAASAEKFLKPRIMSVLTKVTGLILCSLAAQLIFTGIKNFLA